MEGSAQIGVAADVGSKSVDDPFADRFEEREEELQKMRRLNLM